MFRVITGEMAFRSDWEISKYAHEMKPIFPERWPKADQETQLYNIGLLASTLLRVHPIQRPGVGETEHRLHRIRDGVQAESIPHSAPDSFFSVGGSSSDVITAMSMTAQPIVQPALRFAARVATSSRGNTELFENEVNKYTDEKQLPPRAWFLLAAIREHQDYAAKAVAAAVAVEAEVRGIRTVSR
jgi:hypothetical protein